MAARIILVICLFSIFVQDIRYRAVYWITYPILLALLVADLFQDLSIQEFLFNSGINLAFLLLQLAALSLYFSLKNKKWIAVTSGYLGWGDILFLTCLAFYLSPLNYLGFYLLSLSGILLVVLLYGAFGNVSATAKIPLAGLQAILFIVLLVGSVYLRWNLLSDTFLMKYFAG